MSVDTDRMGQSGGILADTGYLLERIAHAFAPASPMLGRVAAAVSIAKLGTRLVPAAGRMIRRHPVGSALLAAGVLGVVYSMRSQTTASRSRPDPRFDPRLSPQSDPRLEPRPGQRTGQRTGPLPG
jgi:hypothetical protein